MSPYKIGIVGNGYVGAAIAHGFSSASTGRCEVKIYDILPEKSLNTLDETINDSEFIFVSVPTPMNEDGSISLKYIDEAFKNINVVSKSLEHVIILKSTVIPGTTEKLQKKFPRLNIVFSPEFLTEKSSRLDFINQSRVVLGGSDYYVDEVEGLYKDRFKYCHFIKTDYKTAEVIK